MESYTEKLEWLFDDLLFQTSRLTYEQIDGGRRIERFENLKEWKSKHGYKFNIYSNDHLINGKKHFHFDNIADGVFAKLDFNGNILEIKGNQIPRNIHKDLIYFLNKKHIQIIVENFWNDKNPNLI